MKFISWPVCNLEPVDHFCSRVSLDLFRLVQKFLLFLIGSSIRRNHLIFKL